jgi:hypothetical protein
MFLNKKKLIILSAFCDPVRACPETREFKTETATTKVGVLNSVELIFFYRCRFLFAFLNKKKLIILSALCDPVRILASLSLRSGQT